jgi:hypothetical protein
MKRRDRQPGLPVYGDSVHNCVGGVNFIGYHSFSDRMLHCDARRSAVSARDFRKRWRNQLDAT